MPKARYVQLFSLPKKVAELNAEISTNPGDVRKEFIRNSCFKGLLYVRSQIIRAEPIVSLISHWDVDRGCFMLNGDRECVITDEDVARIYGLPFGADKEPIMLDLIDSEYASVASLLGRVDEGLAAERFLNFNVIKGILDRDALNNEDRAIDYWRFYVLYALHRLLIPCSSSTISTRYLRFLETPEGAEGFNWAALVKDRLIDGLNAYKQKLVNGEVPTARPTGDMHCLMHLLFDFLESRTLCRRRFTCCLKRVLTIDVVRDLFPPEEVVALNVNNGDGLTVIEPSVDVNNVDKVPAAGLLLLTEKGEVNVVEDDGKRYFMNKKQEIEDEITWCTQRINKYTKRREGLESELKELCEKFASKALKQPTVGVVYRDVDDVALRNNTADGNCESSIKKEGYREDEVGMKDTNNVEEYRFKQKVAEAKGTCELMQDDAGRSGEVCQDEVCVESELVPNQTRDMDIMGGSDIDDCMKDIDSMEEHCSKKQKVCVDEENSGLRFMLVNVGVNGGQDEVCVEEELVRYQKRDIFVMGVSDTDVGVKDANSEEESCIRNEVCVEEELVHDQQRDMCAIGGSDTDVGVKDTNNVEDFCIKNKVCVEEEFVHDQKRDMCVMRDSGTDVGVEDTNNENQKVVEAEGNSNLVQDDEGKSVEVVCQDEVYVEGELVRDQNTEMCVMVGSNTDIDRVLEPCSEEQKDGADEGNGDLMQDDEVNVGVDGGQHDEVCVDEKLVAGQKRDMDVASGELGCSVAIGMEQLTGLDTVLPITRVSFHESTTVSNMSVGATHTEVELESGTNDEELMVLVADTHVNEDISA